MNLLKVICTVVLFVVLATPVWAQDATKKPPAKKPDVQNPAAKKRAAGAPGKQDGKPAADRTARMNPLAGIEEKLNLTKDQKAEIGAILKEHMTARRAEMEGRKAANPEQKGKGQPDAATKEKREAVIAKLQSQGLKGKELKQAVQQSLGAKERPQAGERPKDRQVQGQAELIEKIREVLDDEQVEMLNVALKKRAEEQKAQRQSGKPGDNIKKKSGGSPPGKDGR